MPVLRNQRTYPLALTADPLNTGIVAAYDLASEDGSTTLSNGKDHSGNARDYVPLGAGPIVVATAIGNGRDASRGRTSSTTYYDANSAAAVGLNVGTGDFTFYKRIRTPSYAPAATALRSIGRICDGAGVKLLIALYEVLATGGWHWQVTLGATGVLSWNSPGVPTLAASADTMLHITRISGQVKCYINGVLKTTTNGNTTDFLGTTGSHNVIGNFGNTADVVTLDEIYWSRGLSEAEVTAHAANPYSYYANSAPVDAVTLDSPADSATVGINIPMSGTYAGGNLPGAIEARFNGGSWATVDAAPVGGTWAGTLTGQAPGTGTLEVRWSNNNSITDSASGVTVVSASIAFTAPSTQDSAVAYRMFQRNSSNQASVRVSGTYTGTPTAIECRWAGGAWATLDASPSGGTFDETVTLTLGQGDLEVRFANQTSVTASLASVGVGELFIVGGQSNNVGTSVSYLAAVAPLANPDWIAVKLGKDGVWAPNLETAGEPFDDRTNATYPVQTGGTPLGSYFGALATRYMEDGIPVAFVPCALGSTGIAAWAVNTSTASLYGAMLARATQIGGYRGVIWWQGENDTTGSMTQQQFVDALNALIDDWYSRTGKKWYVWAINQTGTGANFQAIHDAIIEVGQTSQNVLGYADMNGAFSSSIHYGTVGEINEVVDRAYAAMTAAEPVTSNTILIRSPRNSRRVLRIPAAS